MSNNTGQTMDKKKYLKIKEEQLENLIKQPLLNNYYNQMRAYKMGAQFKSTYKEKYVWKQALFLSSQSSKILENEPNNKTALKAMYFSAQIYEILSYISKEYDKDFTILLSSICYDIAGYQANAICLIKSIYKLIEDNDTYAIYENYYLDTIQLFLQKKLSLLYNHSNNYINLIKSENYLDDDYYYGFIYLFKIMSEISYSLLNGKSLYFNENFYISGEFNEHIQKYFDECIISFIHSGNILLTQLTSFFKTRYKIMRTRSTWDSLSTLSKLPNETWEKFLKIISMNIYNENKYIKEDERTSIIEFWNSQLEALDKNILSTNESFVIQMPTSAGKTMIAELCILNSLITNPESKCLYIAPFKALATEVEDCISNHIGRMGYIISNVLGNFEVNEFDDFMIKDADILVATPEKIDLLLRLKSEFFDNVSLIVIDEGHVLGNLDERSALLECLITKLKRKLKGRVRFIFISAVMPNVNAEEFAEWLCANKENRITSPIDYDNKEWQPTKRIIGKFSWGNESGTINFPTIVVSGSKISNAFIPNVIKVNTYKTYTPKKHQEKIEQFPDKSKKNETAVELAYKYSKDAPVLIFCSTPRNVESVAKAFLRLIELKDTIDDNEFPYIGELECIEIAEKWLGESVLTKCLHRGIGFHHGNLSQPIRNAIERDFKNKKLKVLISTSTLGQGVNLPIKTIIVHSLIINPKENECVSKRDFWNIVGRAGRAGKETEGLIIFLCNSKYDDKLFNEYTNIKNIEEVKSIIYILLDLFLKNRISEELYSNYLTLLLESQILSILVEESVDTPDENIIKEILGDSLVKVQSKDLDNTSLVQKLTTISQRFYVETDGDINKRKSFSQTGLSLESCKKIYSFIEGNIDDIKDAIMYDDINTYIKYIILSFKDIQEMENEKTKIDKLSIWENTDFIFKFINSWINNVDIIHLREMWQEYNKEYTPDILNIYIEELLAYKYPWGASAFNVIMSYLLGIEYDDLPEKIRYSSAFIKYGTNNIYTCWAKSVGTPTRETANKLGEYFESNYEEHDLKTFIKWYANLSFDELNLILGKNSSFEIQRVLYQAQKINADRDTISHEYYDCIIKGIPFDENRIRIAKTIIVNDMVELEREYYNQFDVYAIKLMSNNSQIGYIPRDVAKKIAVDIDLYNKTYIGKVISKEIINTNYIIKIRITEKH